MAIVHSPTQHKIQESAMKMTSIFVYGTLQNARIMQTLLGHAQLPDRIRVARYARLHGFARYKVRDRVFPGMIRSPQGCVDGCVVSGLSQSELRILDWYESEEYERCITEAIVRADDGDDGGNEQEGERVSVETYIWKDEFVGQLDLDQPWSLADFEADHLEWFMQNTVEPCRKEIQKMKW